MKILLLASALIVLTGISACNRGDVKNDVQLPKDSVGAISFQGKNIILLNKAGAQIKPSKIDVSKGKVLKRATLETIKVNPCIIRWCPSDGVCEVYVYEQMATCPAWW